MQPHHSLYKIVKSLIFLPLINSQSSQTRESPASLARSGYPARPAGNRRGEIVHRPRRCSRMDSETGS